MNKQIIITIAVIVGLLAIWLLVVLVYPSDEMEDVTEPVEPVTEEQAAVPATGGVSQSVVATVEIVSDLAEVDSDTGEDVDARVTIE